MSRERLQPRSALAVLLVFVCTAAFAAAAAQRGDPARPGRIGRALASSADGSRRLLQRAPGAPVAPQCAWQDGACGARDAVSVMQAVRSRPSSAYLWFLLMTYDREEACGVHTSAGACRSDKQHRCLWFEDVLDTIGERPSSGSGSGSGSSKAKPASSNAAATMLDASPSGGADLLAELSGRVADDTEALHLLLQQQQPPAGFEQQRLAHLDAAEAGSGAAAAAAAKPGGGGPAKSAAPKPASGSGGHRAAASILCTSTDLLENYVFTRGKYSNALQAPLTLHCPGSRAHELVTCMRITSADACRKNRACALAGSPPGRPGAGAAVCVSAYVNSLNPAQLKQFTYDLRLTEPSVVGTCDGACWMRQALLCNRTASADKCSDLSFCKWGLGSCTPRLYMSDNFGSTVQEYMAECDDIDNAKDCAKPQLRLVNKGSYAEWRMPTSPSARCNVQSIRKLLGKDGSAAAGSGPSSFRVGSSVLMALGADEERRAELQAAKAAAALAADAAAEVEQELARKQGANAFSFLLPYRSLAESLLYL